MKRWISVLFAFVYLLTLSASATVIIDDEYTDVTSVMTQDAVLDIEVFSENAEEECAVLLQRPDERSMALLEEVYDFVWREKNRPVRYYDKETQEKIQALVPDVDIDILHLTEFMGQEMFGAPTEEVVLERLLNVDYRPGQLVIAVLGYEEENGEYRWFPYLAEVPEVGLIRYTIPREEYELLSGQPQIIYHVLTDRIGARGHSTSHKESEPERVEIPSKSADDIAQVRRWYTGSGEPVDDDFSIFFVDKTADMNSEIERIGKYLSEDAENSVINWFPEELADEAQLLLGEASREDMIAYDIEAVMSKDYKDTYGYVATENIFTSAYSPDRKMVVMLGFKKPEEKLAEIHEEEIDDVTHFDWHCMRAEAIEDSVEIVYEQMVIPPMETEPAMLVVLSESLDDQTIGENDAR